ncbi:TolC family protein [Rhodocaloribacter sp.]
MPGSSAHFRWTKRRALARIVLSLLAGLWFTAASGQAQDVLVLTLEASIAQAQDGSPGAALARYRFEQSQWSYHSFSAQYRPSLTLTGTAPDLRRSITDVLQDDGSVRFVEQSRMQSSLNLRIKQELPMTGGQFFVQSGLSRVQLFGDVEFTEWQASPLVIGLRQPLFRFNEMRWVRRTEPLRFQIAEQAFREALEAVAVDIAGRFFDVYITRIEVEIASFNVAVNDTIYQISKGRYEIGRIAENDLLQSELALLNAQTALSNARVANERALQNLKLGLGLPYDTEVRLVPPVEVPVELRIDPEAAVLQARRHRAVFLDLELQVLEARRDLARAKGSRGLAADLTASFGLNQSAGSLSSAYGSLLSRQTFSLGFEVPLFRWGRGKADVEVALANLKHAKQSVRIQRDELEQEVYFEAVQLRQLQGQTRIAAKADTVAARRFEVARNRYLIGKISITDLFNAQREKDNARQAYIRTLRQFWISYYRLRQLTLFDFRDQQPTGL